MRIYKNKIFYKWAKSEDLKDTTFIKAVEEIELGLIDGDLGNNLIKKRIARKGQGKRVGFRTILVFQKRDRAIFIYGFSKNQRDNINEQEEKALKKLARSLLKATTEELEDMMINDDLYEIDYE